MAGTPLHAATVFSSLALFNALRAPLSALPDLFSSLAHARVAVRRLEQSIAPDHAAAARAAAATAARTAARAAALASSPPPPARYTGSQCSAHLPATSATARSTARSTAASRATHRGYSPPATTAGVGGVGGGPRDFSMHQASFSWSIPPPPPPTRRHRPQTHPAAAAAGLTAGLERAAVRGLSLRVGRGELLAVLGSPYP